ncbi:MAG: CusA/CzcA family heavy metal efflux RND transporter [Acidobacteria bacterium]|nr:CusA/CzcA family heavy metal efflux RND transporter [Acidobacteriota bacterium]
MINWLLDKSLQYRGVVIGIYVCLGVWGYWAMRTGPVDAIPDLSDHQVIVFTDWPGHSAQEVEDQVTYPVVTNLQGLSGIRVVRSQSAFGFSMVYAIFEDDVDLYFARTRVLERLSLVGTQLPEGVVPTLGPDATGVGHVFWYTLESEHHTLTELRSLQDWFVRYQLTAVPGVAEVASVGGLVRQYQVNIDPDRLRGYGVSVGDVIAAVQASNANVGGNVLESNGAWTIVRGVGLIESIEDLAQVVVKASGGVPVYVRQVADVEIGSAFRTGALINGTAEAVGGVVVARSGANAQQVIDGVKTRLDEIASGLPPGVRVVPFYDRSDLIARAIGTLRVALIEEIALVTLAHVLFLMHFRSILIVTIPLPLAVLMSFLAMRYLGVTSNIMSLAGIAIAIGVLVDAGIVVTENAFRTIEQQGIDTKDRPAVWRAVREATRLVGRPVFFSMSIIVLAFVPVFALTGQEGKLFHPLAFTKTFAMVAATVMAGALVPALGSILLGGKVHAEDDNPVMRFLRRLYEPALRGALNHGVATLAVAVLLFAGAVGLSTRIGSEFMPALDEGDLMFMPIADPSVSLAEASRQAAIQNAALAAFPEVKGVVAKVGRAETSTDPSPVNMTETIVQLRPRSEWREGMTMDTLRAEMTEAVQLPGVTSIWTMPIINRIDMLSTGIRSEVGVKVFGSDLAELERLAREVADVLRTVPGAANVYPEPVSSGQYLNVRVDREAAARYGLTVADVQQTVEYAIGETTVGRTIEGRERYPIRVRLAERFRADPDQLAQTPVLTPSGGQVPLGSVAAFESVRGPSMIAAENGLMLATVLLNVQGRDVVGFVDEAKTAVAAGITMPLGYFVGWSGRYENQQNARARLQVVLPLVLIVIFVLLYFTYHSALEAAHVLLAVPFALTGGVYLVWALDYNFSVAVWVGFIALFGTAVQTGMIMVIYLEDAVAHAAAGGALTRATLRRAVMDGALLRLRPKVMTVSTVVAGLMPIMWSTSAGAEVMRPLAAPVLGGMVSSLLHVLVVTPVIFYWLRARHLPPDDENELGGNYRSVTTSELIVGRHRTRNLLLIGAVVILAAVAWWGLRSDTATPDAYTVIHEEVAGDVTVRLLSEDGTDGLSQGRTRFVIEFRDQDDALVDVQNVRVSSSMAMPGMVMTAPVSVASAGRGQVQATAEFSMSGTWRFTVEWTGASGPRSVAFDGGVR